jgi:1-acyl-sn-glycerol-3-phosphate acyltransferase
MSWPQKLLITATALSLPAAVSAIRCEAGWRVWVCYQIARLHSLLISGWSASNKCIFPEDGPAIIVANHTSPVDPVIIWIRHFSGFRRKRLRVIGYMMAREYYERRDIVGWACRAMQSIPVERTGRDSLPVKAALIRLEAGHLLGLFPEGRLNTSSPDSCLLPGGTGVAWLALKSGVPVLPVFIHNAPRDRSMVKAFFRRTTPRITYGEPMDLSAWAGRRLSHELLAEVTDQIMQAIARLGSVQFTPVSRSAVSQGKNGHH